MTTTTGVAMRVNAPDAPLVAEQVAVQAPPPGWVRVQVAACGVCRADIRTARAEGATAPVTPGH